jgi:serine/threonine protein kinase
VIISGWSRTLIVKIPTFETSHLPMSLVTLDSGRVIRIPQKIGRYLTGQVIGQGHTAVVIHATDSETGDAFAMKICDRRDGSRTKLSKEINREREVIMLLDHPNIIRGEAVFETIDLICIVLEKCSQGDLFSLLLDNHLTDKDELRYITLEILKGLHYLHELGLVHGDLKLENVGMTKDRKIKLLDFGYCHRKGIVGDQPRNGTIFYAAPEIFGRGAYDLEKAEVWALGILVLILFGRQMPYWQGSDDEIKKQILAGEIAWPASLDQNVKEFVQRLTAVDPLARPSVAELLRDPFFGNYATDSDFEKPAHVEPPLEVYYAARSC